MNPRIALIPPVFLGLIGLLLTAPGFRPKQLGWIISGLANSRGAAIAAFLTLLILLIGPAGRLRRAGFTRMISTAVVALVAALFVIDFSVEMVTGAANAGVIASGTALLVVAGWGWGNPRARSELRTLLMQKRELLANRPIAIFSGMILFFLGHECLQQFIKRSLPFEAYGDEIYSWFTMSTDLVHHGILGMLAKHTYYPGLPWLISLPSRIFGIDNPEWLYAFAAIAPLCALLFLIELSRTSREFLCGLGLSWFVLGAARDLRFYYAGTIYGEAMSTLLLAVLLAETILLPALEPERRAPSSRTLFGTSFALAFSTVIKPPLSVFAPLGFFWICVGFYRGSRLPRRKRALTLGLAAVAFASANRLWKLSLHTFGHGAIYDISIRETLTKGFSFRIVGEILSQFGEWMGNPQIFLIGLLGALAVAALRRNRAYLVTIGTLQILYWGFVLTLYATAWQTTEQFSAGRYFSHSALAALLLAPLAYRSLSDRQRS